MAVIVVGDNPESQSYVGRKRKMAEKLGIHSVECDLPADISKEEVEAAEVVHAVGVVGVVVGVKDPV